MRARAYPGTDDETRWSVVDDLRGTAGCVVDICGSHIADPARRWAVRRDTGTLVFVDSEDPA
jgi:hypothetical protein